MAAYEVLLLNTAVPQIQAAQAGDTYVVPRNIAVNAQMTVTGNVGIGTSTPTYKTTIVESNTGAASTLLAVHNSGIDAGTEARIVLAGGNGLSTRHAYIGAINSGAGAGNAHSLVFATNANSAAPLERLRLTPTEAVFNDLGNDYDFRVESDTNTHALFVQGSDGNVGIGSSAPDAQLHVYNPSGTTGFYVTRSTTIAGGVSVGLSCDSAGPRQYVYGDGLKFWMAATGGVAAEKARLTVDSNLKIGGTADRATTVGTKHLDIFDGTAPVGTLANGISIYSSSGEAYVMDAAGNATLFSPHDAETNEWIFKSKHTPTGKVLKIDVERLLKFVNDHFGLDAVHEFIED